MSVAERSVPPGAENSGRGRLARPPSRSLILRTLIHSLNLLPWPWGQEIMASLGVIRGVVSPGRFRRAWEWASHHRANAHERLRLALCLLSNDGRFEAAKALLGLRHPDQLRSYLVVEGVEHLVEATGKGATILLGFHLGPGGGWLALRLLGYPVSAFVALEFRIWQPGRAWLPVLDMAETRSLAGAEPKVRALRLNHARRLLLAGGTICIAADGRMGTEAFRVPVPGAAVVVRSGWLALRQRTRATTLPALVRMEGRKRIVTIHPPLPGPDPDPDHDLALCRETLSRIVEDYVRRFPEQCPSLVLRPTAPPTWR